MQTGVACFQGTVSSALFLCISQLTEMWRQFPVISLSTSGGVLTVDSNNNVYMVGGVYGVLDGQTSAGDSDIVLLKYSASGSQQWTSLVGSVGYDFGNGGKKKND